MSTARQDLIKLMAVTIGKSMATERPFTQIDEEDDSIVIDLPLLADALIEQGYTNNDRRENA